MPNQSVSHARLWAAVAAFCATLISLPGSAVTIPDNPLQTGTAYPPPNIMFILDNSGSMALDYMPDDLDAISLVNISDLAYTKNSLSYNPTVDYTTWMQSNNTRMTGGQSYTAAYSDDAQLSSPIDLSLQDRWFYVPKAPATNPAPLGWYDSAANYRIYKITAGATPSIQYADYGGTVSISSGAFSGFPKTISAATNYTIAVPVQTVTMTITTSGGTKANGQGANLQVLDPSNNAVCTQTSGGNNGNNETCTIQSPINGNWQIKVTAGSTFANVVVGAVRTTTNQCRPTEPSTNGNKGFVNCVDASSNMPSARSLANELKNYATWYSYVRTRIKTAKAGASDAFSRLSTNMRVGYDTIWGLNGGAANVTYRIPVGTNGGLFQGTNRDTWFTQLQSANASGNTPLKGALQRAGKYFEETGTTGPWGPESGTNQISCRQSFALLTTDGYWNSTSGYTTAVGDSDSVAGNTNDQTIHTSADGKETRGYVAETPYIDNSATARADTLADVANYYWKRDLRNLANNVPKSNDDPAFWQHMTTFGISIGLKGNLDPKVDLNALKTGAKRWGNPLDAEDEDRIDDLWHASLNGHGSFVVAKDPTEFANALVAALATVEARGGSASNVTANSTSFIAGARIYQARYVSGKWSGELAAFDASASGASNTAAWSGSQGIALTGRKVFTWTGTAGAVFPTTAQVTALNRPTGVAPINGTDNAAYITGTRTKEIQFGGDQRSRDSLLGDIVNSSPMYVADTNTIYVGANDGMVHAFDAGDTNAATTTDGKELWAYVPGGINFSQLANFSDPQYAHRYFVDGSVVVSTRKQTPGQNILVGALGRGGKGLYALDVTNPSTFGATNAKWEIGGADADMGQVLGDPLIVTLNDATNTKAVLVSNGVNSTNGNSVLFVINLATGAVIKKISTGVGSDNGLSEPRGRDIDGNGTVDYVYAGDLKGNLWKFDLSGATSASWGISGNRALYKTRSGQAITAGVAIARNPADGRAWVFFGTGRYLEFADNADNTVQAMYGVQDLSDGLTVGESELQSRAIVTYSDVNNSDRDLRTFEANAPLPAGKKGWFVLLNKPDTGERIIVRPQMRGSIVVSSSMVPPVASTCDAGGSGWLNAIDAFTGTATSEAYFDVNGDGVFNTLDKLNDPSGTAVGVGSVSTGGGAPTKGVFIENTMFYSKTNGDDGSEKTNGGGGLARRVQWREILQD